MNDPDKDEWYAGSSRDMTVAARLDALEHDVRELKASSKENTELLQSIHDVVVAGKVGTKVLLWLGAVSVALLTIWGAIYAATHGGALLK